MLLDKRAVAAALSIATLSTTGCSSDLRDLGVAPTLSPVNLDRSNDQITKLPHRGAVQHGGPRASLWREGSTELFRDQRASRKGDVFTINISINDKAQLGNSSDRSQESKISGAINYMTKLVGLDALGAASADLASKSSSKGEGAINRSERIQLSVAAIVADVLENGNMYIYGSQEIRVNYELRVLEIAGIVRPSDISRENTIAYEKIAEARVSYGGRGRLMEVQQPRVLQQIYDNLRPM